MPQHAITLTSEAGRIVLTPPDSTDDAALAILRTHPFTRRYLPFFPEQFTVEQAATQREERAEDPRYLTFHVHMSSPVEPSARLAGNPTLIGLVLLLNIDEPNDSCSAGVMMSPHFHRGGFATEALYVLLKFGFEERKFHRVQFETGAENVAMRGWLEQTAGVPLEFRWREAWKVSDGKYGDAVGYSILQQEWEGVVKGRLERKLGTGATTGGDERRRLLQTA